MLGLNCPTCWKSTFGEFVSKHFSFIWVIPDFTKRRQWPLTDGCIIQLCVERTIIPALIGGMSAGVEVEFLESGTHRTNERPCGDYISRVEHSSAA